ncbi:uncharacterized protein LOC129919259 [Episyrphus balteatus]|uniref:uncharacterized protein LOC129919259 n=1 Tax=Episyrphus balteatus TaxID=286459 RepID=UPI0024860519|nr:uncharacterized protein LOC129919259 [Episyrphus balteatus]
MSQSNWTNREQKEVFIKLMEENPQIAKGFSTNRVDTDRFWREAAEKLNSFGPPAKDGATWKKVWADFKSKTKKKLADNEVKRKQSGFNDNNLQALTEFEEAIVRITSLIQSVHGISARVFGINPVEETATASKDVSMNSCLEENLETDAVNESQENLSENY